MLEVGAEESILEVALNKGMDFPHDCKVTPLGGDM